MHKRSLIHILILYLAGIVAGMQFAKFSVTIGYLQEVLGVSQVYSSWLLSALGSMGIIFGATTGIIVGKFSPLKLLAGALWVAGAISLMQPLIVQPALMMATRIIESFTQLIIVSASPTVMLMCTEKRYQSSVMALWGSFFSVAFLLVSTIAPWCIARWGWTSIYLMQGVFSLAIATGITVFAVRESGELAFKGAGAKKRAGTQKGVGSGAQVTTHGQATEANGATHGVKAFIKQHKDVYSRAGSVLPSLLFMTYTLVYLPFLTYIPVLFQEILAGTGTADGNTSAETLLRILVVGMPIFSLIGTVASGFLLRIQKLSPFVILVVSYLMMIGACLLLMTPYGAMVFLITALLFVTVSGVLQATVFGIIPYLSDDPTTHAYANGAIAQTGNTGTTLGSPIFALLLVYGWNTALLLPVLCCSVGIAIIIFFAKRVPVREP